MTFHFDFIEERSVGHVREAIKGSRITSQTLVVWVKVHKSLLSPEAECVPGRSARTWVLPPVTELLERERGLILGSKSGFRISCSQVLRGTPNAVYSLKVPIRLFQLLRPAPGS